MSTPPLASYPIYECRKTVRAFRVKALIMDAIRGFILIPDHPHVAPLWISEQWCTQHRPEGDKSTPNADNVEVIQRRGGYYVIDDKGFATYEAAETFESAHTLLQDAVAQIPAEDPLFAMKRDLDALRALVATLRGPDAL